MRFYWFHTSYWFNRFDSNDLNDLEGIGGSIVDKVETEDRKSEFVILYSISRVQAVQGEKYKSFKIKKQMEETMKIKIKVTFVVLVRNFSASCLTKSFLLSHQPICNSLDFSRSRSNLCLYGSGSSSVTGLIISISLE